MGKAAALYKTEKIVDLIRGALAVSEDEIEDIQIEKKGMTNDSFLFSCRGERYIIRIPGVGTEHLINRKEEADVYRAISRKGICEDVLYINPLSGCMITKFYDNARVCDPSNRNDIYQCMQKLRAFHALQIRVDHSFDIFDQIEFYESLWDGAESAYADYKEIKGKIFSLRDYITAHIQTRTLTHIDAVPDNFLFVPKESGEEIFLIDWEYAGMQDPHVDIAMFGIYSLYNREQMDALIDAYFNGVPENTIRIKIYCYIAACGLLWSNWCEYKRNLGVEFGEYSVRQYRYAKEYYQIATEEMKLTEETRIAQS